MPGLWVALGNSATGWANKGCLAGRMQSILGAWGRACGFKWKHVWSQSSWWGGESENKNSSKSAGPALQGGYGLPCKLPPPLLASPPPSFPVPSPPPSSPLSPAAPPPLPTVPLLFDPPPTVSLGICMSGGLLPHWLPHSPAPCKWQRRSSLGYPLQSMGWGGSGLGGTPELCREEASAAGRAQKLLKISRFRFQSIWGARLLMRVARAFSLASAAVGLRWSPLS